jgi:hypothetical protein
VATPAGWLVREERTGAGVAIRLGLVADPVTELAAFFASKTTLPDADLVRLTSGARVAGHRWAAIAAACGITTAKRCTRTSCEFHRLESYKGSWIMRKKRRPTLRPACWLTGMSFL